MSRLHCPACAHPMHLLYTEAVESTRGTGLHVHPVGFCPRCKRRRRAKPSPPGTSATLWKAVGVALFWIAIIAALTVS